MSAPSPAIPLICPTCGRKYQGDPNRPNARYVCAVDRATLVHALAVKPETPDSSQQETVVSSTPTQQVTSPLPSRDDQETRLYNPQEAATVPYQQSDAERQLDQVETELLPASSTTSTSAATSRVQSVTPATGEERLSVVSILRGGGDASPELPKGKYQVLGKLGQGGVGEVLKVYDCDLKREVAMKMLLRQNHGRRIDNDSLIRFVEEAQATGQLEHPNIVPVHDLGVNGEGRIYFTLKYVQGLSLKAVIQGRSEDARLPEGGGSFRERFTPMRMVETLVSICQAVAYAHSKGIIHRDLKPDNIMLGKYGEVLVMDWGLAKVLGQNREIGSDTVRISTSRAEDGSLHTLEGSIAGTPAYMSPEQAAGKISELDQRTDVYALGAILYEIISGEPPYRGAPALQLIKQVVASSPTPLKRGTAGFEPIPRELKAICEKAMARERNERYASAALLRDDLIAFLENEEVSAAPDTTLQRTIKWVRRNRRQVQTGALSGAAVLVLLLTIWFGWRAWTIHSLFNQAQTHLEALWTAKQDPRLTMAVSDDDPYRASMQADARRQRATVVRAAANAALDPLRRILEISPGNARARLMMAEAYMEMWRLALEEKNNELARATRRDVETYAPAPSPFAAELNGFGSAHFIFDASGTESYLFSFEPLHSHDAKFHQLPVRLIPVPFDLTRKTADEQFIRHEQERIAKGQGLPPEKHSIFNLEPTAASRIAGSDVNLAELPPGSYMLLVRAAGRLETRLPFRMDRSAKLNESVRLPKPDEIPAGFFYMGGGNVIVGGTTAGAVPPHAVEVHPALIYHDEISMGDYGEFLRALVRSGHSAEARQRLPRDFGKPLALLTSGGELVPADRSDPQAFAKSPVRGVSLKDAKAYIEWRSQRDGFRYRLPHDWEWEAACRGADGRTYSWGDQPGKGLAVVTQGYGDTGSGISWRWEDYKDESPWGIHNLAGGAAEWTDSLYDPKAGPKDPVFGQYTIRGNAWALPPTGLECAFRTSGQPDYFHPTIGFRIALDYPPVRLDGAAETASTAQHQH